MKKLSIIIPAYNVSKYIDECLSSLIKDEEVLKELDIIAVNDGSTDDTLTKMNVYAQKYPYSIRVIDKENGGHGSGINKGIDLAEGLYLKVLDSDDWFYQDGLRALVEYIKTTKDLPDMIINPYNLFWDGTDRVDNYSYPYLPQKVLFGFEQLNNNDYLIPLHAVSFKKELYLQHDIPAISEKISYDDIEYILFPVPYIISIAYLPQTIYQYRYGTAGQSVSIQNYIKKREQHKKVVLSLLDYYRNNKGVFSGENEKYYLRRLYRMISTNVSLIMSLDDCKKSKEELIHFLTEMGPVPFEQVPNKKLQFLVKHHFHGFWFVWKYFNRKIEKESKLVFES